MLASYLPDRSMVRSISKSSGNLQRSRGDLLRESNCTVFSLSHPPPLLLLFPFGVVGKPVGGTLVSPGLAEVGSGGTPLVGTGLGSGGREGTSTGFSEWVDVSDGGTVTRSLWHDDKKRIVLFSSLCVIFQSLYSFAKSILQTVAKASMSLVATMLSHTSRSCFISWPSPVWTLPPLNTAQRF